MEVNGTHVILLSLLLVLISIFCGYSIVGLVDKKLSHIEIKLPSSNESFKANLEEQKTQDISEPIEKYEKISTPSQYYPPVPKDREIGFKKSKLDETSITSSSLGFSDFQ